MTDDDLDGDVPVVRVHHWLLLADSGLMGCSVCRCLAGSAASALICEGPPEPAPAPSAPSFAERFDSALSESAFDRIARRHKG